MRFVPLLLLVALSACALFGGGQRYVVFFQERSAQLDAPAQGVIAQAAKRANNRPTSKVEVIGYTDSGGSPPANLALSRQRAQVVADGLVANGVAPIRLIRTGRGQTGADPGVASRRVEIMIAP